MYQLTTTFLLVIHTSLEYRLIIEHISGKDAKSVYSCFEKTCLKCFQSKHRDYGLLVCEEPGKFWVNSTKNGQMTAILKISVRLYCLLLIFVDICLCIACRPYASCVMLRCHLANVDEIMLTAHYWA